MLRHHLIVDAQEGNLHPGILKSHTNGHFCFGLNGLPPHPIPLSGCLWAFFVLPLSSNEGVPDVSPTSLT